MSEPTEPADSSDTAGGVIDLRTFVSLLSAAESLDDVAEESRAATSAGALASSVESVAFELLGIVEQLRNER